MAGTDDLLLIFIKTPQKGKVKTRLAADIGEQQAVDVYQKLLSITYEATGSLKCSRQVWYASRIAKNDRWAAGDFKKKLQKGRDLGERMSYAFREGFAEGFEKVVIIGSDCPGITSQIVDLAFCHLNDHEIVIGPAGDGGYYLLGMSDFYPQLFEDKPWSSPYVLEQTLDQLEGMDCDVAMLPELIDIDTVEDLRASGLDL